MTAKRPSQTATSVVRDPANALNAWLLITLPPEDRQHRGNAGYADDPSQHYRWDSYVANSKYIRKNDLAVVRSDELIGIARFVRVEEHEGTRDFRRCPKCTSTAVKSRTTARPLYRCSKCHNEFDEPQVDTVPARIFSGYFDGTFVATPGALPVERLRAACPTYNGQLAMQRIDLGSLWSQLQAKHPELATLLEPGTRIETVVAEETSLLEKSGDFDASAEGDARRKELRAIALRRGQAKFRTALLSAYQGRCAFSDCDVEAALEAAHIIPYRGDHTNHVQNGLLLRSDLHTLFDLRLITVDVETGLVLIAPSLRGTAYAELHGRRLRLPTSTDQHPSREALVTQRRECGL